MRKILAAIMLMTTFTVWAGDFQDGMAAYDRKDYATAVEKFTSAAEQGNANAQLKLGHMYFAALGVEQDHDKSVRWYKAASAQGLAEAQVNLAILYSDGEGVTQDRDEALRLFKLAADQGFAEAQWILGWAYHEGEIVMQDFDKALIWYKLAADQGYVEAKRSIESVENEITENLYMSAYRYVIDHGPNLNYIKAAHLYKLAAERGNALSQAELGFMYYMGLGVEQSFTEAQRWFKLAAAQGVDSLGMNQTESKGAKQDNAEIMRWFKIAADNGHALSQHRIGLMYLDGLIVAQNYIESVRLFKLSAAQGFTEAQSVLGSMYADGKGVAQNYIQAHVWFNLAAAQGDKEAAEERNRVAKQMTPQQIAQAQKLATECQARNYKDCH